MKTTSCLEINFFPKNADFTKIDPLKFELTLLDNNCYCLSSFDKYDFLHSILSDWVAVHTKKQKAEISQEQYNEFLTQRAIKDEFLTDIEPFFTNVPKEDVSSICFESISTINLAESTENTFLSLNLNILNDDFFKKNEREFCKKTMKDGHIYHGYLINGKPNGFGFFNYKDGDKYIGGIINGKKHGKGYYLLTNGLYYYGDFIDGKLEGRGEEKYKSGAIYIGEFKDSKKNGYGVYNFSNGSTYFGCFKNDLQHGKGIFTQKNDTPSKQTWNYGKLIEEN